MNQSRSIFFFFLSLFFYYYYLKDKEKTSKQRNKQLNKPTIKGVGFCIQNLSYFLIYKQFHRSTSKLMNFKSMSPCDRQNCYAGIKPFGAGGARVRARGFAVGEGDRGRG